MHASCRKCWVGLDQPAYKLFPGLDRADGFQTLIVVFHAAEDGFALIEELKSLGARNVVPEFNAWNKSVKLEVDGSADSGHGATAGCLLD